MATDQVLRDGLFAAVEHSTEPMVLSDPYQPDMPVVAANAAFQALTGYAEAEILGRNCRFLQGPATDAATVRRIGSCLKAGEGCIQWLVNYRRDRSQFWNLLFISPVFGAGGQLLYYFANQHDLSGGLPLELEQFPIGMAHMPSQQQAEFHRLLEDIGRGGQQGAGPGLAGHAPPLEAAVAAASLETTLAAARRVAFLSTRLAAGSNPVPLP